MNSRRNILAAATMAALASTGVQAQQVFEEVIVTAQKREEGLQDTAIAITAISGSTMDDLNISNSSDFEAVVPSLSVRNAPRRLFLRGIGRVTNSLGTDPGIAVYNDQIYSSAIGVLGRASSLTMARVEVLRGPQGTLFGRNATGGAVNVVSKRPTEEFEHHIRAKAGDYDQMNWGVSSSGPITDNLGYRVYGYQNKRDGYIDNLGGKDIWDEDHTGLGAQLSWDATDNLNIWLSYQKDETDDIRGGIFPGGYLITPYVTDELNLDDILLNEGYLWDKENPAVNDPYTVDLNDELETKTDNNNRYTTHITWDLADVTVKLIGNYSESDYEAKDGDFGYTSNPDLRIVQNTAEDVESYAGELQLISADDSALQWVGGLYYYHGETEQPFGISNISADYLDNVIPVETFDASVAQPNPGRRQYWQTADLESESYAVYADANYTFNETWKLTMGLRYSYDEKKGDESLYIVADPNIYLPFPLDLIWPGDCCGWTILTPQDEGGSRSLDDDWDNVSGRIVLDYMYSDDAMLYASISTGYKSGGFRLGSIQPDPTFDPEEVLAYEIGYKGTIGEVLRINAAAYYYDYSDMQVLVTRLSDEGIAQPAMVNANEAEVKGFEMEATWLATDALTMMMNYSYIDGEYTDFCCFIDDLSLTNDEPQDLSGNPLTQAPENKVFFNASYAWVTQSYGEFVPSLSYSWVDERQYDVFDTDVTQADDYYRVDAQMTWYSPSDAIRVILSGRNLTEEETWVSLERVGDYGSIAGQVNEPRTWAVEVQYDF